VVVVEVVFQKYVVVVHCHYFPTLHCPLGLVGCFLGLLLELVVVVVVVVGSIPEVVLTLLLQILCSTFLAMAG
jgi:hypothetical protein